MYGSKSKGGFRDVIKEIRKHVRMDDPHPLGRYLGVNHRIARHGGKGKEAIEVEFDMTDYFRAKCRAYVEDSGRTLRKVDSPHAPNIDEATFEASLSSEGELAAKQCASHLMGCLYGARMAHLGVSVAITRLADRHLERLFAYLDSHSDLVLSGSLSEEDKQDIALRFLPDADLNGDELHT